jgi:protein-L-isoaspartate(D-aspartate) O-methyltransferase
MGRSAFSDNELAIVRRAFARQMLAVSGLHDERVEAAFAKVRREDFLGAEPWQFAQYPPVAPLADNDPVAVYQDAVIALQPGRGVNNGSPSLHAKMLHDLGVAPGQHVAPIGCGAGYYSAILAELVGPSGRVSAYEFDADLAERARVNLAPWPNVAVGVADGAHAPAEAVNRTYVNFAVAAPAPAWTERLKPEGRLLFALGAPHPQARARFPRHSAKGGVLVIDRVPNGFAAHYRYPAFYVCAEGELAGDERAELALYAAFEKGGIEFVKSLQLGGVVDPTRCWYAAPDWGLSYDALDG